MNLTGNLWVGAPVSHSVINPRPHGRASPPICAARAPKCRERGRFYANLARKYQGWADDRAARIKEWANSAERAEWLARPENVQFREAAKS